MSGSAVGVVNREIRPANQAPLDLHLVDRTSWVKFLWAIAADLFEEQDI